MFHYQNITFILDKNLFTEIHSLNNLKKKTGWKINKYHLDWLCGPWFTWSLTRIFDTFVWKYFIELGPVTLLDLFCFAAPGYHSYKILCIWFLLRHFASAHRASSGLQISSFLKMRCILLFSIIQYLFLDNTFSSCLMETPIFNWPFELQLNVGFVGLNLILIIILDI